MSNKEPMFELFTYEELVIRTQAFLEKYRHSNPSPVSKRILQQLLVFAAHYRGEKKLVPYSELKPLMLSTVGGPTLAVIVDALEKEKAAAVKKAQINDRRLDMFRQVINGETFENVGKAYSISGQAVRQQVSKLCRIIHICFHSDPVWLNIDYQHNLVRLRKDKFQWLALVDRYEKELAKEE